MYIPDDTVKRFEDIDNKLYIICSILQMVVEKLATVKLSDNNGNTVKLFDDNGKNQFNDMASILDKVISNESE